MGFSFHSPIAIFSFDLPEPNTTLFVVCLATKPVTLLRFYIEKVVTRPQLKHSANVFLVLLERLKTLHTTVKQCTIIIF